MTIGSVAPAEIVNPKSHLNGTSVFGAAEAEAAGLAPPVAAGAQLASATAAAPFNSVRRPILVLIATLPDRPHLASRGAVSQDATLPRRAPRVKAVWAPWSGLVRTTA